MKIRTEGTERIRLGQEMPPEMERRLVPRLLGYWRAVCGERPMPADSDIEPGAILDLWPHSFLVDIDRVEGAHVFRAMGDQIDNETAGSLVGNRITDAPADSLPGIGLTYIDEVIKKGVSISRGGEFLKPDGTKVLYRSIPLPVGEDGHDISCILSAANCREMVEI